MQVTERKGELERHSDNGCAMLHCIIYGCAPDEMMYAECQIFYLPCTHGISSKELKQQPNGVWL